MHRAREFGFDHYFVMITPGSHPVAGATHINDLEPLSYLDFLCLMSNAKLVLTGSGGIQEETTVLGIPCVTLRENTERPVTITHGTNVLAGMDKNLILHHAFNRLSKPVQPREPPFWDGHAGERISTILTQHLGHHA